MAKKVYKLPSDIKKSLESLGATEEGDGLTVTELAETWTCDNETVRKMIKKALPSGAIKVGRKRVTRIDGVLTWSPCYHVVKG